MKVSVAITTYNGAKFIINQLDSIKKQTIKIDEVIISDDGSTDGTIKLITDYLEDNNLINWKLNLNEKNLGWQQNFYETIKKTTGDYIFLADQDDIWIESKVEEMMSILNKKEDILLLASNYTKIDSLGNDIKEQQLFSGRFSKLRFDAHFYLTKYPGCVLVINKKIIPYMSKLFFSNYSHDQLIWNVAMLLDGAYFYDKPFIKHRIHSESVTAKDWSKTKRINKIASEEKAICKIEKAVENHFFSINKEQSKMIEQFKIFVKNRRQFLERPSLRNLIKIIRYNKFYPRKRTIFGDILFSKKKV